MQTGSSRWTRPTLAIAALVVAGGIATLGLARDDGPSGFCAAKAVDVPAGQPVPADLGPQEADYVCFDSQTELDSYLREKGVVFPPDYEAPGG